MAIVQSAVRDFTKYQSIQAELDEQSKIFHCLHSAHFDFQTLDEALALALFLAQACPEPDQVAMGLTDMLVNAVEHGNLQMTYDEKTRLIKDGGLDAEIARRLTLPEFAHKKATIRFHQNAERIEFTITDQGPGFDWKRYLEINPDLVYATHGRGIAMARGISFDTMEYQGVGNEVVCTINVSENVTSEAEDKKVEFQLVKSEA